MLRTYKYQIEPTHEQSIHLDEIFGAVRLIYNLGLDTKLQSHAKGVPVSCFALMKQLTELKQDPEFLWLYRSPNSALQHALSNIDRAFTNFFEGRAKFPRFKSKRHRQSFHIPERAKVDWEKGMVFIPKLKWVKLIISRGFNGNIRNATVSKTATGKHFISILVETGQPVPSKESMAKETTVGVDLGVKHFATLSDGTVISNPKFLSGSLKRLRVEQRILSRRFKRGAKEQSRNYQKQRVIVAKLHEKVANQRKDFLHKTSTEIVKRFDTVVLEDLNVAGMIKNRKLSRAISDVGWGTFETFVKYKCEWYGKNFEQIGRFEPSSRICSNCGKHKGELSLSEREWTCQSCFVRHDRDFNAAINIRNFGLSKTFRVGAHPLSGKTGY